MFTTPKNASLEILLWGAEQGLPQNSPQPMVGGWGLAVGEVGDRVKILSVSMASGWLANSCATARGKKLCT